MSGLVPGRECGSCAVCCSALVIDTPEFRKVSGVACRHVTAAGGCGIYETRFPVCRQWFCAWRRMAMLDDDWRPDRSGVLIYVTDSHIPAHHPGRTGLIFKLVGDPAVIEDERFVTVVADFIARGVAVFLAVPGEPGYESSRTFLNDGLADAVLWGARGPIVSGLRTAYESARSWPKQRIVFDGAATEN